MKKLLLVPALLASSLLLAQDYNYEITPVAGYNIAEGNLNLSNQGIYGGEFQLNNTGMLVSPELSLLYSNPDFRPSGNSMTNIYRVALNGVYEFNKISSLTPFAKAGVGYETMSEHQEARTGNVDSAFFDAGVGAKMSLTKNIALKLEAVYMLKPNSTRWDNNLALLAGINIAFGEKAQPVVEAPVVAAPVVVEAPKTQPVVEEKPVVAKVAAVVDGDDDHDGVKNSLDKCPNSPAGAKVDQDGCPILVNLHANFKTNSSKIESVAEAHIQEFAAFMKLYPEYNAEIIGYTDNVGKPAYNMKLSEARAKAIKADLEKQGVDAKRITASGKGEANPIASNKNAKGRAENRRIEAVLTK
jgi:OOP family OmpA-OmpF porin